MEYKNFEEFKKVYKKVTRVCVEKKYKPIYDNICYLYENDMNNKNTATALKEIIEEYVDFHPFYPNEPNTVYTVSLFFIPEEIAEALQKRANYVCSENEKKKIEHDKKMVDLLKGDKDDLGK